MRGEIHEGWLVWEFEKGENGKKGVVTVVKRERVVSKEIREGDCEWTRGKFGGVSEKEGGEGKRI